MTSLYQPDQTNFCNGGDQFTSGYSTAPEMLQAVSWTQQPQPMHLPPMSTSAYPNSVYTRTAKSLDEQTPMQQPFYGYCPSITPLSCPSSPTSPVTSVKTDPDGYDGRHANPTDAMLSDDQLVKMSVRDLNYLLQVGQGLSWIVCR